MSAAIALKLVYGEKTAKTAKTAVARHVPQVRHAQTHPPLGRRLLSR